MTTAEEALEIQAPLLARATLWSLAASLLGPAPMPAGAAEAARLLEAESPSAKGLWHAVRRLDDPPADLEAARLATFGHIGRAECPWCEADWFPDDVFAKTNRLADIAGFYRAFGLERRLRERVDHVALECEFMGHLLRRAAAGRALGHSPDDVDTVEAAARSFFADHVGAYLGAFGRRLARLDGHPYFRAAGRFLERLAAAERRAFALPPLAGEPSPAHAPEENDDACGGCPLHL